MGWFKKNNEEEDYNSTNSKNSNYDTIPDLPDLPELPNLPGYNNNSLTMEEDTPEIKYLSHLPSIPSSSSYGEKFSQNAIKEAVSGNKEGDKRVITNEVVPKRMVNIQQMQKSLYPNNVPQRIQIPKIDIYNDEVPEKTRTIPKEFKEAALKVKSNEPVFIRIDKFQKALEILEETKDKISEMKKNLHELKQIKNEEESELETWENEITNIKSKIDKIDSDLFSRVE